MENNTILSGNIEAQQDLVLSGNIEAQAVVAEVAWGKVKGDIQNQTDLQEEFDTKVDKVVGKGLSTNDYTNAEKTKLANLENYDDTEIRQILGTKVDKVSGKQLSTEDFTTALKTKLENLNPEEMGKVDDVQVDDVSVVDENKIAHISFNGLATEEFVTSQGYITGITGDDVTTALGYEPYNKENPDGYQTEEQVETAITSKNYTTMAQVEAKGYATETYVNNHHDSTKQNTITDLSDIRSGASKGATAVQPSAISDMATQTWVNNKQYVNESQASSIAQSVASPLVSGGISQHNTSSSAHNTLFAGKADLENGKVPLSQLPDYIVADVVQVETYEDLPEQGQSQVIYYVKQTQKSYRWVGGHYLEVASATSYYSITVGSTVATMGNLKNMVDNINTAGDHAFFDLHYYFDEGYVCTVHFFDTNKCEINDILNDRIFGVNQTWTSSQLITNYLDVEHKGSRYDVKQVKVNGTEVENNRGTIELTIATTLADLTQDATHRVVSDTEKSTWNNKQGAISDLETIRSGAGAGATAVQPSEISDMATKTWVGNQGYQTTANLESSITTSTTKYPSSNAVKTYVDSIVGDIETLLEAI